MADSDRYIVCYSFRFEDGVTLDYPVTINTRSNLSYCDSGEAEPPDWVRLDHAKCDHCRLPEGKQYCPVALRLVDMLALFGKLRSYMPVEVTVKTPDRSYVKNADVQEGLRSLLGLIMATSGCPSMKYFKPMARFHLPFSSLEETVYRITTSYLLGQLCKQDSLEEGSLPYDLSELQDIYNEVQIVNGHTVKLIRKAVEDDGALNALTILDSFSQLVPMFVAEELEKMKPLFG